MGIQNWYIWLVWIFLTGCTFTSEDEYFETIDPPDPSKVSVSLSEANAGDTIKIYESTLFRYSINANGGKIKTVRVTVGGLEYISGSNSATGEFNIHSTSRSGMFEILIEFTSTTGTGSLADVLDAEEFSGSRKWVVMADFAWPATPTVDFQIVDGLLKVSWPEYAKPNFKKYYVQRYVNDQSYGTEITDPKQNFWFDNGYTGGPKGVSYRVTVQNSVGSATVEKKYSVVPRVQFAFNKNDTSLTVQWNKNPFYAAFKAYEIGTPPNIPATITNINDTVRVVKLSNLFFGGTQAVTFEANAIQNDIGFNNIQQHFVLGDSIPAAKWIYYSPQIQSYLLRQENPRKIVFMNNDFDITREENAGLAVLPYPGKYYYDFSFDKIHQVDIENGIVKTWVTGSSVTGWSGTGNGLIVVSRYYRNFGKFYYSSIVHDLQHDKLLYADRTSSTQFDVGALPVHIADDGKYFIAAATHQVYKVVPGDTSVLIGELNPGGKFAGFRADKSSEIMYNIGSSMMLYDANTLAFLRKVGPPQADFQFSSYDHQTKYMLWTRPSTDDAYLLHIETGGFRHIKLGASALLLNGYLFIPDRGVYIKALE